VKLAVVLFNLGGPDSLEAVVPFLTSLFSDPAVISLPWLLRKPLAHFIANKRGPVAREIYQKIGGRSPILEETQAQAAALQAELGDFDTRVFIAMRHWKPFSDETAKAVAAFAPDQIVALPLYPQFSTTTTGSSFLEWKRVARAAGVTAPIREICCYPEEPGFIASVAALVRQTLAKAKPDVSYRLLISAHGLPKRVIASGDPYQWQIEKTAAAIVGAFGVTDFTICYQSRVGPLEWIGPSTDAEIRRAGAEGKGLVVVPVAFVSEHSETLVELDIEYAKLAAEAGVPDYLRVPTVGVSPPFVAGLAQLVRRAVRGDVGERRCPPELCRCSRAGKEG
jgi:ferrochelatase